MTIIHFVRHGRTSFTSARIAGYLPGIHLTPEGEAQAARAAHHLEKFPITAIYASPLDRAMETGAFIAGKFNLKIRTMDFLKEIDFGKLQGMGKELENEPSWHVFVNTPSKAEFPLGESVSAAQTRIVEGLNRLSLVHASTEEIVCVSHCEVMRLALAYALNQPLDSLMKITVETGSISRVRWEIGDQQVIAMNIIP